jgi:hypothetical protein
MLRVAFTSEFTRGRLQDLVALVSGRNFETKQYEESIAETAYKQLKQGILNFMNETHFKRFIMIIRSAGFVDPSLIGSQNALNFAYIIYLTLRGQGKPASEIEKAVRRWFVMSLLTTRYSGSPESTFDYDIRKIREFLSSSKTRSHHGFLILTHPVPGAASIIPVAANRPNRLFMLLFSRA